MIITIEEVNHLVGDRAFCSCTATELDIDKHSDNCAFKVAILEYRSWRNEERQDKILEENK